MLAPRQPDHRGLASKKGFEWQVDSTAHFSIFVERGSEGSLRLDEVRRDVEQSLVRVHQVLDVHDTEPRSYLFLVDSRERMRDLIGAETNGMAFYKTRVLCYIVNERMLLSATHELLHVVAMNRWGVPEHWLNEGLAVFATGNWHGHDIHALAAYLGREGVLLPLDQLMSDFNRANDLISYPQAGSVVRFLYETHGVDAVRSLWKGETLEQVAGLSVGAFEAAWKERLEREREKTFDYSFGQ